MIHIILDIENMKMAKFTTNVSGETEHLKVNYTFKDDDSNVIADIDCEISMADFLELIEMVDWDGEPIEWMNKKLTKCGNTLVLERKGEQIAEYRIQPKDKLIEIDVTAFEPISPVDKSDIVQLSGVIKTRRFRLYYGGVKR